MITLIKNVTIGKGKQDVLIIDEKVSKIESGISVEADNLVDGCNLKAINGLANCYFDGNLKDCDKLLSQGITTVFDFSNDDEVTKKLVSIGISVYKAIGDFNGDTILDEKYLNNKMLDAFKLGSKDVILFVKNPNTDDESQYNEIIQFGKKHNLLIATSVSESLDDVGEIDKQYNMSPVALLESYGFLDFKNLLIDCVCVDKEDVDILTNYDTTICVCPTKNLKNGSGVAPTYSFIRNKLNIVLGGVTNSIFQEIELCKNLQSGYLNEANILSDNDVIKMVGDNVRVLINGKNNLSNIDIILIDEISLLDCTPINVKLSINNGRVIYNTLSE